MPAGGHRDHGHDQHGHDHGGAGAAAKVTLKEAAWWRSLFVHDHGPDHGPDHGLAGHDHHAHHDHGEAPVDFGRAFAIGTLLNLGFVVAEIGFGVAANSLALIADGAHNLSDALGLLAAWFASWLGRLPPSGRRTYGYRRASIIAALLNATLLIGATAIIIFEACTRLLSPAPVEERVVILVAGIGIAVNVATALLFLRRRERDLNARGAYAHMVADAGISVGVVIAGLLIVWTKQFWIDPAVSLLIGVIILIGSWRLTRDTIDMALDAVPSHLDRAEIEAFLGGLPGVRSVHDLHVWAMSTTETALTAHLVREEAGSDDKFLAEAREGLRSSFAIAHVTLQIERGDAEHPCALACEEAKAGV
ncbi:cobalt-zinc-cadmium efflux system protein [Rhizobiales bacterium GAS191]|nr:cobalt-zinc-cadmium efflux system protein [Rhizobiales bacterium GAS191]